MDVERIWALNVEDKDFVREFMQRFPLADFIPTREGYLGCETAAPRTIDAPHPDSYVIDDLPIPKKEKFAEIETGKPTCPGCKREFMHKGALALHKRKCEALKNLEEIYGKAVIPSTH